MSCVFVIVTGDLAKSKSSNEKQARHQSLRRKTLVALKLVRGARPAHAGMAMAFSSRGSL